MFSINKETEPTELKKTNDIFKEKIKDLSIEKAYDFYKKHKNNFKYNTSETKKIFKEINFCRCSFCSQIIKDFNDEMTIEHIKLKSRFPAKIFEWDNLLCSCRTCNIKRATNMCDDRLYLDPSQIKFVEYYFEFNLDGEIVPNNELNQNEQEKAKYMIGLYKLNREELVYDRREFYNDLLDDDFFNRLNTYDKFNKHIIFLSLFAYYKKEKEK